MKKMTNKASVSGNFVYALAKGENGYQSPAALFGTNTKDLLALHRFQLVAGEAPGFTNLCGLDRLTQVMSRLARAFELTNKMTPYIAVAAKHGNPCGLAIDWHTPEKAIDKALFGNPMAIWGGEVMVNFPLHKATASFLVSSQKRKHKTGAAGWMLDIVAAPEMDKEALKLLGKRGRRKLFVNPALRQPSLDSSEWVYRFVRGGMIQQKPPNYLMNLSETEKVSSAKILTPAQTDSLLIAWATAFNSMHGGNEVALARNRALLACGGGPSTIEAVKLALFRARLSKHRVKRAVFAADAFFPFTDVPELLVKAGVVAGVVPAGGQAFTKVKKYFKEKEIIMYYPAEQYRGFCFH